MAGSVEPSQVEILCRPIKVSIIESQIAITPVTNTVANDIFVKNFVDRIIRYIANQVKTCAGSQARSRVCFHPKKERLHVVKTKFIRISSLSRVVLNSRVRGIRSGDQSAARIIGLKLSSEVTQADFLGTFQSRFVSSCSEYCIHELDVVKISIDRRGGRTGCIRVQLVRFFQSIVSRSWIKRI